MLRTTVVLFLLELTGGFSPPAMKHMRWLQARSARRDRTQYTGWAARRRESQRGPFMMHWMQRISTAVVTGNARRGLNAIRALEFRFTRF